LGPGEDDWKIYVDIILIMYKNVYMYDAASHMLPTQDEDKIETIEPGRRVLKSESRTGYIGFTKISWGPEAKRLRGYLPHITSKEASSPPD
jgi:hypothetical protein